MSGDSPVAVIVLAGSVFVLSLVALASLWEAKTGEATRWKMGGPRFSREVPTSRNGDVDPLGRVGLDDGGAGTK